MSSKSVSQIFKTYFKLEILTFFSFTVSFLIDMFNYKAPFLTKKTPALKSETYFSREAIENQLGKVFYIIGRSWSSSKLFIVQKYTKTLMGMCL